MPTSSVVLRGQPEGPGLITAASADGTHFVDQNGNRIFWVGEDCWAVLANGGAWNSGDYQAAYTSYLSSRAGQGYNAVEVSWCSFPNTNGASFVHTNGADWDGTYPFATALDPSTSPNGTFWARRDAFLATARANGITVVINTTTPFLEVVDADVQQRDWTTTQWQDFGTFLGNRYKDTPGIIWIVGDDYFGSFDTQLNAWLASLRATGDAHLVTVQCYQEATSRLNIWNGTKDPNGFSEHAQLEWGYSYNVTYPLIEQAQLYTPTAADDVQGVTPPLWADGFYLASGTGAGQTDVRLERQMIWWALTSGAAGFNTGDNQIWGWASTSAGYVTSKTFYSGVVPAIAAAFRGLTGWHQLHPDTTGQLVTAGRGTKATPIQSGGGGTPYLDNTDNYVTASRTPDTGSGSALAVIYCGKAFTITVDQSKMRAGYTARRVDPLTGASTTVTAGSTYNSGTWGNNSAGDPDWVLILEG